MPCGGLDGDEWKRVRDFHYIRVRARVTRLLSNSREFHRSSILIRSSVREKEEEIEKGRENLGRFDFWPIVNLKRSKNFEIVDSNVRSTDREKGGNMKI